MIRYDFRNKVALVTGSPRGIGAAVLRKFAEAGATCVLHYWDDPDGANRRDAEARRGQLRREGSARTSEALHVSPPTCGSLGRSRG